jgi:hypothetical protein
MEGAMPSPGSRLSLRQARFLAALLTHDAISDAAQATGIAETTAHTWLKLKHFDDEYARARKKIVRHALAQVQRLTSKAVHTLDQLMDGQAANVQAYAARTVLDIALRAVTYDDHEQRLNALEEEPHAGDARAAS